MFGSWPRRGLVVLGGALAVVAFAAVAMGAVTEKSKRIAVGGAAEPSTTVRCPRGTEAVSGGFLGTGSTETALQRLERVSGRKFRFRFENRTPTSTHADVSALCSTRRLGLEQVTRTGTITAAGDALTASCPMGMKAVSGGVSVPEAAVLFVQSFRRLGDSAWTASFYTEGRPTPGVKVFALCADHPGAIREVTNTRTVPGAGHRSVTARCPRGEHVVSGGWSGQLDLSSSVLVSAFGSIRDGGRGWTSSAEAVTAGSGSLTSFAYCMRR